MAIYWPTPGFKGRTFKLCVLTRWDFNSCVHSSPLQGYVNKRFTKSVVILLQPLMWLYVCSIMWWLMYLSMWMCVHSTQEVGRSGSQCVSPHFVHVVLFLALHVYLFFRVSVRVYVSVLVCVFTTGSMRVVVTVLFSMSCLLLMLRKSYLWVCVCVCVCVSVSVCVSVCVLHEQAWGVIVSVSVNVSSLHVCLCLYQCFLSVLISVFAYVLITGSEQEQWSACRSMCRVCCRCCYNPTCLQPVPQYSNNSTLQPTSTSSPLPSSVVFPQDTRLAR